MHCFPTLNPCVAAFSYSRIIQVQPTLARPASVVTAGNQVFVLVRSLMLTGVVPRSARSVSRDAAGPDAALPTQWESLSSGLCWSRVASPTVLLCHNDRYVFAMDCDSVYAADSQIAPLKWSRVRFSSADAVDSTSKAPEAASAAASSHVPGPNAGAERDKGRDSGRHRYQSDSEESVDEAEITDVTSLRGPYATSDTDTDPSPNSDARVDTATIIDGAHVLVSRRQIFGQIFVYKIDAQTPFRWHVVSPMPWRAPRSGVQFIALLL